MGDIFGWLKKLLGKTSGQKSPYIQEQLKRDEQHQNAYALWKKGEDRYRILKWLYEDYLQSLETGTGTSSGQVTHIDNPPFSGFIIDIATGKLTERNAPFLFDYLKERLQDLGYALYMSDVRTFNRDNYVEQVERHYLKPRQKPVTRGQKIDQRWGNATIELIYIDDVPKQLRFHCKAYADSAYHSPQAYRELIEALFTLDS